MATAYIPSFVVGSPGARRGFVIPSGELPVGSLDFVALAAALAGLVISCPGHELALAGDVCAAVLSAADPAWRLG